MVNQCVLCEVGTEMINIRFFLDEFQASKIDFNKGRNIK
jgi:hypothetical protein